METKIRRKGLLICLFLAALTCFALMGFLGINSSPKTAYAGEVTSIKTEADLWDALQTSGSYRLDRDIHLLKEFAGPHDHSYDVTGEIVLDLNGHMIDRATSMHWQFDIIKDAQLTIMDSWGNGCSAVVIYNYGKLILDIDKDQSREETSTLSSVYNYGTVNMRGKYSKINTVYNYGTVNMLGKKSRIYALNVCYGSALFMDTGGMIGTLSFKSKGLGDYNSTVDIYGGKIKKIIVDDSPIYQFNFNDKGTTVVKPYNDVIPLIYDDFPNSYRVVPHLDKLGIRLHTSEYPASIGELALAKNSTINLKDIATEIFDVEIKKHDINNSIHDVSVDYKYNINLKGEIIVPYGGAPAVPTTSITAEAGEQDNNALNVHFLNNGEVRVYLRTTYTEQSIKDFVNDLTCTWYRLYPNGSWQEITNGESLGSNFDIQDTVDYGVGNVQYKCVFTSSTGYVTKQYTSAVKTVATIAYAPNVTVSNDISGTDALSVTIKRNQSVNLTAKYSLNVGNLPEQNAVGGYNYNTAIYQWEIFDEETQSWTTEGLKNSTVATFTFGGSNASGPNGVLKGIGTYKMRVAVRTAEKVGGSTVYSLAGYSLPREITVRDYYQPNIQQWFTDTVKYTTESGYASIIVSNKAEFDNRIRYAWQFYTGTGWKDFTDGENFHESFMPENTHLTVSGATTDRLELTHFGEQPVKIETRCYVVTGSGGIGDPVGYGPNIGFSFRNIPLPTITQDLLSSYEFEVDKSYEKNNPYTLTVQGTSLRGDVTYQWQTKDGSNWVDMVGETNNTLSVARPVQDSTGKKYRCVITNETGPKTSTETLVKVIDDFVLNVTPTNLTVEKDGYEHLVEGVDYWLDNANRTLTCYMDDVQPFVISFDWDIEDYGEHFEDITETYSIVPNWRATSRSYNQTKVYRIPINQVGTFTYNANLRVVYDRGDNYQYRDFNANNTSGLSYTVNVLPKRIDPYNYQQVGDQSVVIGEDLMFNCPDLPYKALYTTGSIPVTATSTWRYYEAYNMGETETHFTFNAKMSSYKFVKNYQLFVELPNGRITEYKLLKTWGVANFADYENPEDALNALWDADTLNLTVTAEEYAKLLPEDFYGVANAYIVMNYMPITEEEEGTTYTNFGSHQGEMFTIQFIQPCRHENYHIEISYMEDNGVEGSCNMITYNKRCDICNESFDTDLVTLRTGTPMEPVAQVNSTATVQGVKEHKKSPWEEKYYVWDGSKGTYGCWMETDYNDLLLPLATTGYVEVPYLAPTCTTNGHYEHLIYRDGSDGNKYIEVDGAFYINDPTISASHSLDLVEYVAPTCEGAGTSQHYKCSVCSKLFSDITGETEIVLADTVIPATGHLNPTHVVSVAPTCTTFGKEEYWHCEDCDKYFSNEECTSEIADVNTFGQIAKVAHDYEWVIDKEAEIGVEGKKHEQCKNCGEIRNENTVIPVLAYEIAVNGNVAVVTLNGDLAIGVDVKAILSDPTLAGKDVQIVIADKGAITFNADAVTQLLAGDVVLLVREGDATLIEGCQLVLEICINNAGVTFTGNAKATVTYAFSTAVPSGKVAKVYYVIGATKENMNATFASGKVTFETTHFSTYAVVFETEPSSPSTPSTSASTSASASKSGSVSKSDSASTSSGAIAPISSASPTPSAPEQNNATGVIVGIVIACVVLLGAAGVCYYLFVLKKKKTN